MALFFLSLPCDHPLNFISLCCCELVNFDRVSPPFGSRFPQEKETSEISQLFFFLLLSLSLSLFLSHSAFLLCFLSSLLGKKRQKALDSARFKQLGSGLSPASENVWSVRHLAAGQVETSEVHGSTIRTIGKDFTILSSKNNPLLDCP